MKKEKNQFRMYMLAAFLLMSLMFAGFLQISQ